MASSERGCCVPTCGKTRNDDTIFHSFPYPDKDKDRFLAWIQAVRSSVSSLDPQYVDKNHRVCHAHFEMKYLTWTRRLSPGAIPTLFLLGTEIARNPLSDKINSSKIAIPNDPMPSTSQDEPSTASFLLVTEKIKRHTKTNTVPQKPIAGQKDLIQTVKRLQIKKIVMPTD